MKTIKPKVSDANILPEEVIITKIYYLRGKKVMLDRDLAILYGVETKHLNKAVKRNIQRFPDDFMFQLTKDEIDRLRFQFGTLDKGRGKYSKYLPYVFTEQGVAMLSAVLNSERAVNVSIQIVRVFVKLREMLITHKGLREKIEHMERKYDKQFRVVFEVIKRLLDDDKKPKREIGFQVK